MKKRFLLPLMFMIVIVMSVIMVGDPAPAQAAGWRTWQVSDSGTLHAEDASMMYTIYTMTGGSPYYRAKMVYYIYEGGGSCSSTATAVSVRMGFNETGSGNVPIGTTGTLYVGSNSAPNPSNVKAGLVASGWNASSFPLVSSLWDLVNWIGDSHCGSINYSNGASY